MLLDLVSKLRHVIGYELSNKTYSNLANYIAITMYNRWLHCRNRGGNFHSLVCSCTWWTKWFCRY